jgi:CubicO group peptidase (beta-lactamase class C family)
MFTRAFGLLASIGIVASIGGHFAKLAGAVGVDTFRWASTATGLGALVVLGLGLAYQRLRRAHLRRTPQRVPHPLTPIPEPMQGELDRRFVPLISSARVAAAVVGLRRGENAYYRAYSDPDAEAAIDDRTVFEIGSISKTFTALLLAQLVLGGEVELEEPVSRRLPELDREPSPTLLDLATHRSGLPRLPLGMLPAVISRAPDPYARWNEQRLLSGTRHTPSRSSPGTSSRYSNLGFALLGLALSRATGASYGELIREQICAPLGMADTGVGTSAGNDGRVAPGHDYFGAKATSWNMAAFSPAGGIRSTAADMQRYLTAQMDPDRTPFGAAIRFAQEPRRVFQPAQLLPGSAGPRRIGLAWITSPMDDGHELVWHNGGTGGYGSFIGWSPEAGIVALTNSVHARRLDTSCREVIEAVSSSVPVPAPAPRPSSSPSAGR